VDVQHRLRPSARHDFIWGGEYRRTMTTIRNTSAVMTYTPEESERDIFNAFAQDELRLSSSFAVTAGAKIEYYESLGFAIEPSVRAIWSPRRTHRLWASAARGVRTPSLADQIATFVYGVFAPTAATRGLPVEIRVAGQTDQKDPEALLAYEVGYRAQLSPAVSVDVAAFRNQYSHLSSYSRGPASFSMDGGVPHLALTSTHANLAAGTAQGAEAVLNWSPAGRWSMSVWGAMLDTSLHMTDPTIEAGNTFLVLTMSPHAQAMVRSSYDVSPAVEIDGTFLWNGTWQMGGVEGYTRTDVRTGWKVTPRVSLDFGVQNLFDGRHRETASYLYTTPTDIPRSVLARLMVTF
jgi:iron complex outermembrane recepter protein